MDGCWPWITISVRALLSSNPSGPDQIRCRYSGRGEKEARADLRREPRSRGELARYRPRYGLLAHQDILSFIDSGPRIRARGKRGIRVGGLEAAEDNPGYPSPWTPSARLRIPECRMQKEGPEEWAWAAALHSAERRIQGSPTVNGSVRIDGYCPECCAFPSMWTLGTLPSPPLQILLRCH